jgi:hypothetical protein
MLAVVFEMRKLLTEFDISCANYKAIDAIFVTYFPRIYQSVASGLHGGQTRRNAQVPAYFKPITDTHTGIQK